MAVHSRRPRRLPAQPTAPRPAVPHRQPRLSLLGPDDCERLHAAACQVLSRTGVKVFSPRALEMLRQAGAQVEGDLVRIPPDLVTWALAQAPRAFTLYRRGTTEPAVRLDGEATYFGPGSDTLRYLDPRSGERRDFKLADVADCMHVCDALPEIGFVMSVGIPRDVPTQGYFQKQFATMLRHTVKPIVFVCNDREDIEVIGAMAAAVAGGMDALSRCPSLLLYSEPTTPLSHSAEAVDKLLYCAEHAIPVTHSPAPMMGGTAPVTVAGAVVLGNAEMLSGLVMHQLQRAGAPFLYGHGVHHLDMKEMISVYGAPEFQLARVLAAEMGRFYKLPVWGYAGHSDSKVLDGQAAADAQFSVLIALLAKTNLNHDVGYLEAGLAASPELIVLTDEIIAQTRHFCAGVALDDESLAVDVIDAVGPGGEFLSHDHTLAHWRELFVPELFDRQRLEPWQQRGARDINARLRDKTVALMESHRVPPLADSAEAEIERLLPSGNHADSKAQR
jgi:trimethylamine--corrinoid protein Co-methyltransferase